MAFVKGLIVCVVFVAIVVKGLPEMFEEDALVDDSDIEDVEDIEGIEGIEDVEDVEEPISIDVERDGFPGDHHHHNHHAHSFSHFSGPVIGHHEEISWKDKHGDHHYDYKAHPKYKYSYGVEDHHTKDHHGQKEHRDGKHVEGEYHIQEPGGNVRSVKYHSDAHGGFYAEVHNHGGNDHSGGHHSHHD